VSGAIGTAEKLSRHFDAVADHAALAVLADRRHCVNGAFKAVEGMPRPSGFDVKGLIVIIPADFAPWHTSPRSAMAIFRGRVPSSV
jgi:hypothetical protein